MAHEAWVYPGFYSTKRVGVFHLLPGWDDSPLQGCPQHLVRLVPIYTLGWREALMFPARCPFLEGLDSHCLKMALLARKVSGAFVKRAPGPEPGLLDPEMTPKTMRSPRLPHYVSPQLLFHLFTFHTFKHQFCSFHTPRHSHFLKKGKQSIFC